MSERRDVLCRNEQILKINDKRTLQLISQYVIGWLSKYGGSSKSVFRCSASISFASSRAEAKSNCTVWSIQPSLYCKGRCALLCCILLSIQCYVMLMLPPYLLYEFSSPTRSAAHSSSHKVGSILSSRPRSIISAR
jgi:hypothetical protein